MALEADALHDRPDNAEAKDLLEGHNNHTKGPDFNKMLVWKRYDILD